ncbi:hypothetical protein [Pedomonas mirosovicensis]|uniref:hypothetical protein n=1 Tax=Pedomonas mirosovicensis TaxID=2908641 RepID=UPI00216822A1|nr:hypothetical protein [Pedomonas mirosovicensis]MCH8685262.1 hypothetical protein [Pedomonas mirosovicensis]
MAWTSTRLAVLGAILLASIVSVIAVGQRELSRSKPAMAELSLAAYPDNSMLTPAGYRHQDHMKSALIYERRALARLGLEPHFARL